MKKLVISLGVLFALLLVPSVVLAQQAQPLQPGVPVPTATPFPSNSTPTPAPYTGITQAPSPAPRAGVTVAPTPTPPPPKGVGQSQTGSALDFAKIAEFAQVPLQGSLGGIVSKFVPYIFGAAGIILFFYLIWGGFSWMLAKGDPKATSAAREKITKAVVGFAIIFTAYWLTQILGKIFGISQFQGVFQ